MVLLCKALDCWCGHLRSQLRTKVRASRNVEQLHVSRRGETYHSTQFSLRATRIHEYRFGIPLRTATFLDVRPDSWQATKRRAKRPSLPVHSRQLWQQRRQRPPCCTGLCTECCCTD